MAKKIKLTPKGHAVQGALLAYLAPKIAADSKPKLAEVNSILKSITPGSFKAQMQKVAEAVKSKYGKLLVADASLEDLPEILEALRSAEGEEYEEDMKSCDEGEKDDDLSEDEEGPGEKLLKILAKYEIAQEDLNAINDVLNELAKPAMDEEELKPEEKKEEKPGVTPKAMDAAIAKAQVAQQKKLEALYAAKDAVRPYIGEVNALSFDSAEDIYKLALDSQDVDLAGAHPSAYRSMLKLLNRPAESPKMAIDAKGMATLAEKYPNAPEVR